VEGAPHRGEGSETNEGVVLLLGDLGSDVDGGDVWEGESFRAAVTALTRVAVFGGHARSTAILCGASDQGCSGQRYSGSHVCWCPSATETSYIRATNQKIRAESLWKWPSSRDGQGDLDLPRCRENHRGCSPFRFGLSPIGIFLSLSPIPPPMKQPGAVRKPYNGHKKALAIALDVGTTFSGVSYAVLDPGEVPKIYEVTRSVLRVPSPPHFRVTLSGVFHPSCPFAPPSVAVCRSRNTWANVIVKCRFPGQEHQAGNPKIPTIVWYDRHGDAVKAGAEAEEQSIINTAEEQGWTKVELYVSRPVPMSDTDLPPPCTH